ncbi:orotidine-5'-phosphate decarboxylase [Karstenula rhodostoma CBS 690.94]|uniref:Orotidine 5'-phosphate decarboxylase n=1 Tax=Karstenula rhodostoma CBS 690.94 TaxID=1392251 RepID=A0A9P4UBC0_9PLEO|nr:orotidine-5'-phosphate decarboxylase [Karstenula rhodostoma CBS 690.94]
MAATTYRTRAGHASTGPLASYLLRLMSIKQTNLCLSADVETSAELLDLAEECGDHICVLKTHCDIVTDWSDRTARALKEIARRKCFIIFEDRKFADIGETVQKQYTSGLYRIASWAEITNAHVLPGPAIVTALHKAADATIAKYNTGVHTDIYSDAPRRKPGEEDDDDEEEEAEQLANKNNIAVVTPPITGDDEDKRLGIKPLDRKQSVVSIGTSISQRTESISPRPDPTIHPDEAHSINSIAMLARLGEAPFLRSLLLLAEMSSEGHLMTPEYQQKTLDIARNNQEFVMGFIAQRSLNTDPDDNFITMTPGCQLPPPGQEGQKLGDTLGQQYNTPRKLIFEQGCDVIIVGRGIVRASDRALEAARYRDEGWRAYEERVGVSKG